MKKNNSFAVAIGATANLLLFFLKLFIGLFLNSVSILVDSVNNLTDSLANFILIYGIKISEKPADKKHPFGHGRAEHILTFVISSLMIFASFEFLRISIESFFNEGSTVFNPVLTLILSFSIIVKVFLFLFYKKYENSTLKALSRDSLNDTFITLSTVIALFIPSIDGFLGIGISIFIFYSGFSLAKSVVSKLLGEQIDKSLLIKIEKIINEEEMVLGIHDIAIHNYGDKNIGTLHVEMPEYLTLIEAHEIVDLLEIKIKEETKIELSIHIDPLKIIDEDYTHGKI